VFNRQKSSPAKGVNVLRLRTVVLAGMLLLAACGREGGQFERAAPTAPLPPTPAVAPGGGAVTSAASCVETYSLDTLKKRAYAFDGTVVSVSDAAPEGGEDAGAQRVAFDVHRWFKGGSGAQTTRVAYGFGTVTSAGGAPHKVGDRLLVAGDEGIVWECGFTQAYDAQVAAQWEQALS
jgi:hypothetical protein